jgi:hypothetical protein
MAISYNDKYLLANEPTFQNRVKMSLIAACIAIKNEAVGAYHSERETFAVAVMNNPEGFKALVANGVSTDTNVINDATATGATILTTANIAAQQALVTDPHIDTAIASQFNSFFRTPAR